MIERTSTNLTVMVDLFLDRYRIPSIRLSNRDYSAPGIYFITICTKYRFPWFGYIKHQRMCVNRIGMMVYQEWYRTAMIRPHIILDTFMVMPNHIHGIIHIVETCRGMSLHQTTNQFSKPIAGSISMIINHFKSAVTRQCRNSNFIEFRWQPRFYERVIRNDKELYNVRKYIMNNPKQFQRDNIDYGFEWLKL